MVIDKTVKVSKAADDLSQGLVALVKDVKKAMADGFQVGSDVPVIVSAIYVDLIAKIGDLAQLGPELAEDKYAFQRAWSEAGIELEKVLLG